MKTALFLLTITTSAISLSSSAETWMHFQATNSPLPSNSILCELTTDEGIWVGTDAGLAFYDGNNWQVFTTETSILPDDHIRDIHQDVNGIIWVATDEGVLKITQPEWEILNTSNSGLPSDLVRSISSDSEGNMWFGTWGEGVARLVGNEWEVYNLTNSEIPSNGIFHISVDALGHAWIGTYNGGVTEFDGISWNTTNSTNSLLPHDNVRSIVFCADGTKWVCTDDGLAKWSGSGAMEVFTFETIGYTFHVVNDGVQRNGNEMYFATDGGILEFNPQSFRMITSQNSELPNNNIRTVTLDQRGYLWLGTANNGLVTLIPEGSVDVKEPQKGADLITVYPNPVDNEITILLPNRDPGNKELIISNGIGQTVIRKQLINPNAQRVQLDVNTLRPGYYTVTISSNTGISTSKFLKT